MNTIHNVQPLHSYRAHLVPEHAAGLDLDDLADAGLLPTVRVKAANATHAHAQAHIASGKSVLRVERIEEEAEEDATC